MIIYLKTVKKELNFNYLIRPTHSCFSVCKTNSSFRTNFTSCLIDQLWIFAMPFSGKMSAAECQVLFSTRTPLLHLILLQMSNMEVGNKIMSNLQITQVTTWLTLHNHLKLTVFTIDIQNVFNHNIYPETKFIISKKKNKTPVEQMLQPQ